MPNISVWLGRRKLVVNLPLGGALADPVDEAVFLFQDEMPAPAEHFAEADPYVRAGLVTVRRVRPWTIVVGDAATMLLQV